MDPCRSGTVEEFSGSVLLLGDVKRGASVIAAGDIVILGR
jgi:septum formation inhibitor MinC